MRRKAILLLLAIASTTACVAIPAKRSPKLARPGLSPNALEAPAIRLQIHDRTSTRKKAARSIDRALRKLPYLSNTSAQSVDYDYTIELTIDYTTNLGPINELSALSFFVIPAWATNTVSATATVTDSRDSVLGAFQATGKNIEVAQMHLLWIAPVAIPFFLHVDREMWNSTIRNVFVQAGEVIVNHREQQPASQGRSPIRAPAKSSNDVGSSDTQQLGLVREYLAEDQRRARNPETNPTAALPRCAPAETWVSSWFCRTPSTDC